MKKLLLLLVLVFICVVGYKAYNASQTNGKSVIYNVGKSGKEVTGVIIDKGTEVTKEGIEVTKDAVEELNEGIQDSN